MRELALFGTLATAFGLVWGVVASHAGDPPNTAKVGATAGPADVRFGRDIRPILSDRCFLCHGPDGAKREANLRLDVREDAVTERKDGAAIVPGQPDKSELIRRITSHDANVVMPPGASNKRPISAEEADLIRRWIEQGAPYEQHWAFQAPVRPQLPATKLGTWAKNPVDAFILASLESKGLGPSPETDKATLFRRVFLDLTGLPPSPAELDEFLNDSSPNAYEAWVDKLLTKEPYITRYAERMTAPWLDASRYADTCGIHTDAGRSLWPWRDWVLRAFHDNMPFDRFITEQLAGDLLPNPTADQKIATGFNRNHVTTDEAGAIPEEYLVEYAVDRVSTTGSVLLGLTLGCARCHDHKFDPVSMEDFYSLYAFFNSIEEPGLYSQLPDAKRAFEPFMEVPTAEQQATLAKLAADIEAARADRSNVTPEEAGQLAEFKSQLGTKSGIAWTTPAVTAATSRGGATLTILPDNAVLASGSNPDTDEHTYVLKASGTSNRLILLEALSDPSLPAGRVGRAYNGNAVLSAITVEAVSSADPSRKEPVSLIWGWADVEQDNGDYALANVITGEGDGWAVDAHRQDGNRNAIFLADKPFGFEGGTELRVTLSYNSVYAKHTLGKVRLSLGTIAESALASLPELKGYWLSAGPFPVTKRADAFAQAFGPEEDTALARGREFGPEKKRWRFTSNLKDGVPLNLEAGNTATYFARKIYSPVARKLTLSLGSDDGIRVFVNGRDVFSREIDRSLAPDQDKAEIPLSPGANTVVIKIANTGGPGGIYQKTLDRDDLLEGSLAAALLPATARWPGLETRLDTAWFERFSPRQREVRARLAAFEAKQKEIQGQIAVTMIMKELPQPRETFVLSRGQYDHPDTTKPVKRATPHALGALPADAPANRLGLAQWMTASTNPLVSRVTANRLWEQVFGEGIVRTTEDFGLQGEWPSHPELLDWLAVEFREGGWDVRRFLRLLVTSATYTQSARVRADAAEKDPENRLLAYFPRKRLSAEKIRDQALYASGLLVEKLGGPSVKPYQPAGLWEEVSMPASNTRVFQRDKGEGLYRRSIYTYWKRASPHPAMMAFDSPTRESCVVRRSVTNTPLQALALWNDEQLVEAARVLAVRTMKDAASDADRVRLLLVRCTSHPPSAENGARLSQALAYFRARYAKEPEIAKKLLSVGDTPAPMDIDPAELAAWTMMANAALSLDTTITRN